MKCSSLSIWLQKQSQAKYAFKLLLFVVLLLLLRPPATPLRYLIALSVLPWSLHRSLHFSPSLLPSTPSSLPPTQPSPFYLQLFTGSWGYNIKSWYKYFGFLIINLSQCEPSDREPNKITPRFLNRNSSSAWPLQFCHIYCIIVSVFRITCEAMVFNITEDGLITADTLCNFVELPRGATYLVGDRYQVRTFIN